MSGGLYRTGAPTTSEFNGPAAEGAVVLCQDGVARKLGPLVKRETREDPMCDHTPKETFVQFTQRSPCKEGWLIGAGAGVKPGAYRTFKVPKPADGEDRDPGPAYRDGARVRSFGDATFREVLDKAPGAGLENKKCSLERGAAVLRIDSSHGCGIESAVVLPGDRSTSFLVWTSDECLAYRLFPFSAKTHEWVEIADDRSCG